MPGSTLELYREALRRRREEAALGEGPFAWLDSPQHVLALVREPADAAPVISVLNLGATSAVLPAGWGTEVLLASSDDVAVLDTHEGAPGLAIGAETAVWLRPPVVAP